MWIWCCLEPQVTAGSTVNLGRYREPQDATIELNSTVNGRLIPNSGRYSCSPQSPDRLQTLSDIPTHHVPDAHYPVKKRLENEADLTSPCSAEFWNAWNYATRTSYVQTSWGKCSCVFCLRSLHAWTSLTRDRTDMFWTVRHALLNRWWRLHPNCSRSAPCHTRTAIECWV